MNILLDTHIALWAITDHPKLPEKARELIMAYGTDRVLFGTDYPMWEPAGEIARFMQIDLTERQREDILYHNAAKLFRIGEGAV